MSTTLEAELLQAAKRSRCGAPGAGCFGCPGCAEADRLRQRAAWVRELTAGPRGQLSIAQQLTGPDIPAPSPETGTSAVPTKRNVCAEFCTATGMDNRNRERGYELMGDMEESQREAEERMKFGRPRCLAPLGDDDTIGPRGPGYCDVYEASEGGRCRGTCAVAWPAPEPVKPPATCAEWDCYSCGKTTLDDAGKCSKCGRGHPPGGHQSHADPTVCDRCGMRRMDHFGAIDRSICPGGGGTFMARAPAAGTAPKGEK
jgi:hypothetical protein